MVAIVAGLGFNGDGETVIDVDLLVGLTQGLCLRWLRFRAGNLFDHQNKKNQTTNNSGQFINAFKFAAARQLRNEVRRSGRFGRKTEVGGHKLKKD